MTEVSQKASTETQQLQELLPKHGVLHQEITPVMALCKPKLLPLKSVTLEKLEKMQKDAQQSLKEQDDKENEEESKGFEQGMQNMAQYPDGHNNDSNSWQPSNSDDVAARLDGGTSDKNVHDFMSGDGP